jgi:ribosomal protein S11
MSKIYNEDLYNKIKQNFDNKDELVKILTSAFNDTYAYLSDNDQQPLALLVVGGAWVEGMYLTTHVSEAAYQVAGISKVLLEQKKSFRNVSRNNQTISQ